MKLCFLPTRLFTAGLMAIAAIFTSQTASAQILRSSDKFASTTTNNFTIYNNVWGGNAGPQELWVYAYNNWGVHAYHTGGGIKSYPNISKYIGKKVSAVTKLQGVFTASVPSSGAWALAYDIWNSTKSEEIMLWFNYTGTSTGGGNVKPISASWNADGTAKIAIGADGKALQNVSVGGHTWNIFKGKNGSINVYSFLRTSKTSSATVDIRAILNFLKNDSRTKWISDFTVGDVQHGFEITSCGSSSTSRATFKFTSYSLNQ